MFTCCFVLNLLSCNPSSSGLDIMAAKTGGKKKADMKVVIMGDFAIGKTALLQRYISGAFQDTTSTIGASFMLKQWGPYNIAIWDTAGNERYSGLTTFYVRGASAAILAYDISDRRTFDILQERFLPILEGAEDDCLIAVVGTKLDLVTEETRQVLPDEAENLAKELNTPRNEKHRTVADRKLSFETSAKSGHNVEELFSAMFDICLPLDKAPKTPKRNTSTVDLEAPSSNKVPMGEKAGCCN
ncbi:PREDICTED: ras-related protein Rab-20-like [Branchiostoma belcheri]|uniref:Ras-related protein Rab-20-like n=1 Tax=Branchiostoma belcheri TaxID=7741 RepID=A0A6P4ZAZ2_BRABE|nr:PREDICTED: ras-related protein Rab-20-like [Branchiostoma belcheri]